MSRDGEGKERRSQLCCEESTFVARVVAGGMNYEDKVSGFRQDRAQEEVRKSGVACSVDPIQGAQRPKDQRPEGRETRPTDHRHFRAG
jgi:hypothetical protein